MDNGVQRQNNSYLKMHQGYKMKESYIAIDIGASSGRAIAGYIENDQLKLKELSRFWNGPINIRGQLHWDFLHLYKQIQDGLRTAKDQYITRSLAIDTWGVDFGLIDSSGNLIENPIHYRDSRTSGIIKKLSEKITKKEIFDQTGIQFMELNTLNQIYALYLQSSHAYSSASNLLFSPDLLNYWLTGQKFSERTISSTSQIYNPKTKDWAYELLETIGLRTDLFAQLIDPGTKIGEINNVSVVACGGHDTACAFAATPLEPYETSAILSSGTWSLLGCELTEPIINTNVLEKNFTNEVGVNNSIRFLKNLNGLWIIQELQRIWKEEGYNYTFSQMVQMAESADPFKTYINPADERFFAPGNMEKRIYDYCDETDQYKPKNHSEIIRTAYEGLALLYAETLNDLEELTEKSFSTIRIVGGGAKNHLLNQMTANATAKEIHSGPSEATAVGNCIMQMIALGDLQDLSEGRDLIRHSFQDEMNIYIPSDISIWENAKKMWVELVSQKK